MDDQTTPGGETPETPLNSETDPTLAKETAPAAAEPEAAEPGAPAPEPAAGSETEAGIAAAQAESDEARRRARRNTIAIGAGLFAVVFALLGYQLSNDDEVGYRSDQRGGQGMAPPWAQQGRGMHDGGGRGDGDGGWGAQQQMPQGQQQGQMQQGPPTSRAS